MSPVKHSYASETDGQTDRQTTDKVIPMCRHASQATLKDHIIGYPEDIVYCAMMPLTF